MSEQMPTPPADDGALPATNGIFINNRPNANGFFTGHFTTPEGDVYDIALQPREVTDPRTGEVSTLWGGYATARDRDLVVKDAALQAEFKKTGARPAELFAPESRDIPLYLTLRNRPGKGYTDIGSFWNARGRYTVLARDLAGKAGLRFGGNVLTWKSGDALEAERTARAEMQTPIAPSAAVQPDGDAARANAGKRAGKGRDKAPTAEAGNS
jgi:hypothetical protein